MKQDVLGNDKIFPWKPNGDSLPSGGVVAYLEIDNRKCIRDETDCFTTANEVLMCDNSFLSSFFV